MLDKRFVYIIFCITFTLVLPPLAEGGVVVSKYGGEFLRTGVGARPLGMGGAFVAVVEDVTAIYWNPAGLVGMGTAQIHGMHAERFTGIVNYDFIGVGLPFKDNMAFGLGFLRLGVDGIPFTALRDPTRGIGEFYIDDAGRRIQNDVYAYKIVDDSEMALVFSFAKARSERISFGGNVKLIRKSTGEHNAWGLGFDMGIRWNPYRSLKLGLVLVDGTSTLMAWNSGEKELILPHLRLGLAYPVQWGAFRLLPVLDVDMGFENRGLATQLSIGRMDLDFHSGVEVNFRNRIAMRIGSDRGRFTAGAGFQVSAFHVDYGFSRHVDLGNTHRISITLLWDKKRFLNL